MANPSVLHLLARQPRLQACPNNALWLREATSGRLVGRRGCGPVLAARRRPSPEEPEEPEELPESPQAWLMRLVRQGCLCPSTQFGAAHNRQAQAQARVALHGAHTTTLRSLFMHPPQMQGELESAGAGVPDVRVPSQEMLEHYKHLAFCREVAEQAEKDIEESRRRSEQMRLETAAASLQHAAAAAQQRQDSSSMLAAVQQLAATQEAMLQVQKDALQVQRETLEVEKDALQAQRETLQVEKDQLAAQQSIASALTKLAELAERTGDST